VLNHVFVTNVAMIQPQNGYNQYYFALDSTFFKAKLIRPRPGRGQMLKAEDNLTRPRIRPRPKFWPQGQCGLKTLTSLVLIAEMINTGKRYTCMQQLNELTRVHFYGESCNTDEQFLLANICIKS